MVERVSVDGDRFGGGVSFVGEENLYERGDSNTKKRLPAKNIWWTMYKLIFGLIQYKFNPN